LTVCPAADTTLSAVKGHARNMMTERVASVGPDTPLAAIAATLVAGRIGGVPVVGPGGSVLGFVSETDVVSALLHPDPAPTEAREIMSQPPIAIDEFATADEVIATLRSGRIHHLPVTRAGKLVGIITPLDVLRWFVEHESPVPDDAG
jgi:CBS domain-containing protein